MPAELSREWYAERGEQHPDCIGDGVYASWDGYSVILRTPRENGVHEIVIDAHVWQALLRYRERVFKPRMPDTMTAP